MLSLTCYIVELKASFEAEARKEVCLACHIPNHTSTKDSNVNSSVQKFNKLTV